MVTTFPVVGIPKVRLSSI